jgi:hypothetical protein
LKLLHSRVRWSRVDSAAGGALEEIDSRIGNKSHQNQPSDDGNAPAERRLRIERRQGVVRHIIDSGPTATPGPGASSTNTAQGTGRGTAQNPVEESL